MTISPIARIRGVYPRGLIEALRMVGSNVAAGDACIRGVYPRGLIEAALYGNRPRCHAPSIRGVYPRGLIEARSSSSGR